MLELRDNRDSSESCDSRELSACNHLETKRDGVEFKIASSFVFVMNFANGLCGVEFILSQMANKNAYLFLLSRCFNIFALIKYFSFVRKRI